MPRPRARKVTSTPQWRALRSHFRKVRELHMRDLFAVDPARAERCSLRIDQLYADYSKHRVTDETLALLLALADAAGVEHSIARLFAGEKINTSERRPALHTALRAPAGDGKIPALASTEIGRVFEFARRFNAGEIRSAEGSPLDCVVHIGIGGSDLGPRLALDALHEQLAGPARVTFVSNVDERDFVRAVADFEPCRTLFIVASKSFGTMETAVNAERAREWLVAGGVGNTSPHFVAITANDAAASALGIPRERIFRLWDWVGGRYSIWSSVGLPLALKIGEEGFRRFLAGGHAIDLHFRSAPPADNLPLVLALLDVWYGNFFGAQTLAVVPYDQRLRLFPEYLSQLMMESNGKSVDKRGRALRCATSPVIWGAIGTNAQHAFFQLLHQGTQLVPVDFLAPAAGEGQQKLIASCLAQSRALMMGRDNEAEPHRHFPGNRPSTTILYEDLTPYTLGMLIALYEHRVFAQAAIWNINPFDQWGVELGKALTAELLAEMAGGTAAVLDSSTRRLLSRLK